MRITVAEAPPGPWVKALAVMPAIAASRADLIVVADADVWCETLPEAVEAVRVGAAWAMPHQRVLRLSERATREVLAGRDVPDDLVEKPHDGTFAGGIVVARRETLLEVPLDPRFVGWGQEDESWGMALHWLAGPCARGDADLIHLYHPPAPRSDRRKGNDDGWRLMKRYMRARGNPRQMATLIEEAKLALQPHLSSVHATAAQ